MGAVIDQKKSYNYSKKFYEAASVPQDGPSMTKYFEGYKDKIYKDTRGIDTIGYGFNVKANKDILPPDVIVGKRKLTKEEAEPLFTQIYQRAQVKAIDFATPQVYQSLTPLQQNILTDMSYNLGDKIYKFKKMREALLNGDTKRVVKEMKNSDWYKQVKRRSKYHVNNFIKE